MTPGLRGAAAAVVCALTLVACSGAEADPDPPSPTSRSETSASPSTDEPTATEPPPSLPPEAQAQDIYGAAAFIRFYFDTMNYAYRTSNLRPTQAIRQSDCEACVGIENEIDSAFSEGGQLRGGQIAVVDVVVTPGDMSLLVEAAAVISQEPGVIIDATGTQVDEIEPATDLLLDVNLERSPNGWVMSQWGAANDAP